TLKPSANCMGVWASTNLLSLDGMACVWHSALRGQVSDAPMPPLPTLLPRRTQPALSMPSPAELLHAVPVGQTNLTTNSVGMTAPFIGTNELFAWKCVNNLGPLWDAVCQSPTTNRL